jgi:hypothetical protein
MSCQLGSRSLSSHLGDFANRRSFKLGLELSKSSLLSAFSYHCTNSHHGIEGTHGASQTIRCNLYPSQYQCPIESLSSHRIVLPRPSPRHYLVLLSLFFAQVHIPSSHNRTPTTTASSHAPSTASQGRILSMMLLHYNHLSRGLSRPIIWLLLMMSAKSSILLVSVLRRALALVCLLRWADVLRGLLVGVALLLLLLLVVFV